MATLKYPLEPPSLSELANVLRPALEKNYKNSAVEVQDCPDLRQAPFHLAAEGLTGNERVADVGGQPNLFPCPLLEKKYDLLTLAKDMEMDSDRGALIGAGAGPFHILGQNSELAANISWHAGFDNHTNLTYYTKVAKDADGSIKCDRCPSADCALMINLFGSTGLPGPVLKITARGRRGSQRSFTECIRNSLHEEYQDRIPVSLGGAFVIKSGTANFHVMPDFPPESQLPFKDRHQLNDWLTYHDFEAPIVCLSVLHSADPEKKLGLRMEHTHCFTVNGENKGGHYHYDVENKQGEEIEYEAYFNTAKTIYRIDKPSETLKQDLHD